MACRQVQAAQVTQRDCSKCHSALTLMFPAATFAPASEAASQGRTARPRQRQGQVCQRLALHIQLRPCPVMISVQTYSLETTALGDMMT